MRQILAKKDDCSMTMYIPERDDILNLKVGDKAPNCFGGDGIVTKIYCLRPDIHGKWFVCYYAQNASGLVCSMSMKENELIRTVRASDLFTSAELDTLARNCNAS